jgi:hypothetical protein
LREEAEKEKNGSISEFQLLIRVVFPQTTFFTKLKAKSPPNELTSEAT